MRRYWRNTRAFGILALAAVLFVALAMVCVLKFLASECVGLFNRAILGLDEGE